MERSADYGRGVQCVLANFFYRVQPSGVADLPLMGLCNSLWENLGGRGRKKKESKGKMVKEKKPTSCKHRDDTPLPKETNKLPQTSCVLFRKGTAQPSARQHWLWGWCWGGKAGSKGTGYHAATSCLTGLWSFPLGQCALTCNTNPFSFPTPRLQIY